MPHIPFLIAGCSAGRLGLYAGSARKRALGTAAATGNTAAPAAPEYGKSAGPTYSRSSIWSGWGRLPADPAGRPPIRTANYCAPDTWHPPENRPGHGLPGARRYVRDNLELKPNQYRITLESVSMSAAAMPTGMFLAINPGRVLGELQGTQTRDPAFGLPAVWIDANQRRRAQTLGYTVVDASTVVATHLSNILNQHAARAARPRSQALLDPRKECQSGGRNRLPNWCRSA